MASCVVVKCYKIFILEMLGFGQVIMESKGKIERVLDIYTKLINGALVNKAEEAINHGVNERTIQRDIDDIRNYFGQRVVDGGVVNSVIYDRTDKGFKLEQIYKQKFTNPEILAICKILLDSRAFTKKEMEGMLAENSKRTYTK